MPVTASHNEERIASAVSVRRADVGAEPACYAFGHEIGDLLVVGKHSLRIDAVVFLPNRRRLFALWFLMLFEFGHIQINDVGESRADRSDARPSSIDNLDEDTSIETALEQIDFNEQ